MAMKQKIIAFFKRMRPTLSAVVREHPVELGVLLYLAVRLIVAYECLTEEITTGAPELFWGWVFAVLAYAVNTAAGRSAWRKIYYVSWLPMIPLSFVPGLSAWWETSSGLITLLVLTPLLFLICRWAVDNRRFVFDWVIYLRAAVLALLFANVTFGLLLAILYSTAYIFGIEGVWLNHVTVWLSVFTEVLSVPMLFMIFVDRRRGAEFGGSRMADVLLHHILVPALLIYMVIFALYILKIVVTWSLPRGGVAYLVFGLTIFAFLLHALRELLPVKRYDWFFNRFGLWLLPFIVLFWSGVAHRVDEYGLTEPRVYLLASGAIMTIGAVLFLSKRYGRYLGLCLVAFGVFAALAFVPQLNPERLAERSQSGREADYYSVQARIVLELPANLPIRNDAAYGQIYCDCHTVVADDTLRIRTGGGDLLLSIAVDDLLRKQFGVSGFDPFSQTEPANDQQLVELLDYRDSLCRVVFGNLVLQRKEQAVTLDWANVGVFLSR